MSVVNRKLTHHATILLMLALASGCASQSFVSPDVDGAGFMQRQITQTQGPVTITAAVPDAAETESLFGMPLYDQNVQPVWLKIENSSAEPLRLTLWRIDPDYYSPLEVAWMNRGGYDKEGKAAMERWLYENGIGRRVAAGGSQSGFVFTHVTPGTKGFNVDVFSSADAFNFTFFVPMPGFTPDYMTVDLQNMYPASDVTDLHDLDEVRGAIENLPCCATDSVSNAAGEPINIVLIGTGEGLLRAFLRAGWLETETTSPETVAARRQHYRGRPPDGVFYKSRADGSERKELRVWLTPFTVDEDRLWVAQMSQDLTGAAQGFTDDLPDPDIDSARSYLLQDFWYSQSLARASFVRALEPVDADNPRVSGSGTSYFTDGLRTVLWVSESPVGLDDGELLTWDLPTLD